MNRVYNFSPGPSMLPLSVLERAQQELVCCGTTGMSVMEMSHRSKTYLEVYARAGVGLAGLMHIPDTYASLLLHGGATQQFAAVPLNLSGNGKADYSDSGNFSHAAAAEAGKYIEVRTVASSREDVYTYVPDWKGKLNPDADYLHITTNNTIYGTRYIELPDAGNVPLVADMSSNIPSEVYDINKFGAV